MKKRMRTAYFIYNSLIIGGGLLLAPFWLYQLATKRKHRSGFLSKLGITRGGRGRYGSDVIWVHAVSVGEVKAALPLVRELKKVYPASDIVVSTVTATGQQVARENFPDDTVVYFPFDFRISVRRAIEEIAPSVVIIFETELWPNFLRELSKRDIPILILNGRISSHSFKRFFFFRYFMEAILANVDMFGMQSESDRDRIVALGAKKENVVVCGNIKYECRNKDISDEAKQTLRGSLGLREGQRLLVAGSTHQGEEEIILNVYKRLLDAYKDIALLIAPRHPERGESVARLIRDKGFRPIRRSKTKPAGYEYSSGGDVILLDTVGELSSIYSTAELVYIGGSLSPHGGQNILEPAYYKKPVIFGNYMDNFRDISRKIIEAGGGIMVESEEELYSNLARILASPEEGARLGEKGYQVILQNRGALKNNIDLVKKVRGR